MINILLEGFDIDAPWLYDELKNYIQPNHSVAVVAFSFRDNRVKSLSDWNALYSKECGKYHDGIVGGFTAYGIPEENISFINYFTDTKESAAQKIKSADIVYFLGGLPDRMMDRIKEFDLYDILMQHDGILMGYSAGAVIQLAEYHLSPDDDYPEFKYYEGLPYLNDFYMEVHIGLNKVMITCIDGNIGSEKTILANGGVYEYTIHEPNENVDLKRFWITL